MSRRIETFRDGSSVYDTMQSFAKIKPKLGKVKKVKPRGMNSQQPQIKGKKQNFNRSDGQYNPRHSGAAQSSMMGNHENK